MNAVELFAGIGGFGIALERNGVPVVAQCEIDKHAQKVLKKHFPSAKLFNDVKEVTGEGLIECGFEPDTGIIVGGFPCQDVSVAGKRAGLTGADGVHTRSGLFWEVVRILDETKASTFILENVPGLLSSNKGNDFATILVCLQNIGYGDISWRILDSQFFGVSQRRRRVFIVGRRAGTLGRASAQILDIAQGRAWYLAKGEQKRKVASRNVKESIGEPVWWNGAVVTDSLTTTSNEQRMPDKGRFQAVIMPFTPSSFGQYQEGVGTLRSNGGDLGGSETLLALSKPEILRE